MEASDDQLSQRKKGLLVECCRLRFSICTPMLGMAHRPRVYKRMHTHARVQVTH